MEASLKRLGIEYIDLFQIHRFDPLTPIEETMQALHDLVRSGKVRSIGASLMRAFRLPWLGLTGASQALIVGFSSVGLMMLWKLGIWL